MPAPRYGGQSLLRPCLCHIPPVSLEQCLTQRGLREATLFAGPSSVTAREVIEDGKDAAFEGHFKEASSPT